MRLRFNCPTCLRRTHAIDAQGVASTVHDRTCQACGARWRFVVQPLAVNLPGVDAVHAITNTSKLENP